MVKRHFLKSIFLKMLMILLFSIRLDDFCKIWIGTLKLMKKILLFTTGHLKINDAKNYSSFCIEEFKILQGILVPKLIIGPFLTLNIRNGTNWKTGVLGSRSWLRVKVNRKTNTNILLSITSTKIPNFKLLEIQGASRPSF